MSDQRSHDLVVFGATGFTGGLTAEYLAGHPDAGDLDWAIAGRNRRKLEAVRQRLSRINPECSGIDVLVVDVEDDDRLSEVVAETRTVITAIGPYIHYGEPLVRACAEAGTDYVDLTGEPEFVDRMLARYDGTAHASGARIVHCCGFDSIPHDLGVLFTIGHLPRDQALTVRGFVRAGGTLSGGTWHSAIEAFARARQYLGQRRELAAGRKDEQDPERWVGSAPVRVYWEDRIGAWACPFPTIDPQVVKRSARALEIYGPDFRYGHFAAVRRLPWLLAGAAGVSGLFVGAQVPPVRRWLQSMREPGEGPDADQRAQGWFQVRFLGRAGDGSEVLTQVAGGDPGYGDTAKMLGESALCLARDEAAGHAGGILTPAVALGRPMIERLQAYAGITFEVLDI